MKYIFIIVLICTLFCCKKYPDDERTIHIKSVKSRLVGHSWQISNEYNFVANKSVTISFPYTIYFSAKGDFGGSIYPNLSADGKWEFTDHKNKLKITGSNGISTEYAITRLDNYHDPEGSWLYIKDDSLTHYFHSHDKVK